MSFIVEKLKIMGLKVQSLDNPVKASGEEFLIDSMTHVRQGGYDMTVLDGYFIKLSSKDIPAGTYILDMAQPLANLAFYALEPQVGDGFVGWNILDDYLLALGVNKRKISYPVFKYFTYTD
jgi:hypothetical protein